MSNKTPKLAVLSQAQLSSSSNNNNTPNNNTITLVVCPKSTTSIRLNESEKQNQYPYYERLCKNYGFSLEVEIVHCQQQQQNVQSSSSVKRGGGGPKMSHVLLTSNATTTSKSTSKLQYHSERLIIRPLTTTRSKKSDHQLRPDFQNGDVMQSIDGMNNPTFGMVYAVMMRGDKLLLEIERRGAANRGRSNSNSAGAVVGVAGASITNASLEQQETTTTVATTATTTKKKRQVSAWDAENRRVQRDQKKLQKEQEKERLRQQRAKEKTATTTSTTAATSKKQSKSSTKKNNTTTTTAINVHSPSYITKAVARLEKNVQEYNRQQREEEEAMYGEDNRMLLDYTLADGSGDEKMDEEEEEEDEDEVMNDVNHDGVDKAPSIVTMPTVDLTLDDDDGGRDDDGGDNFSVVNSLGSSDYPPPLEPSSPIQAASFAAADGNNKSSSSSSSSDSSSSSGSSSSSSSSSSDSDSSSSDNNCNTAKSIQPPQTITTTSASASNNKSMSTPPRNGNNKRFTPVAAPAPAAAAQLPTKRPRSSSSTSNDGGGKTYPTYSSTMNYSSRTTTKSCLNEAPTSLNRLWPDPSDIVKALTKWQPPSATVKQRYVEFYGAVSNCVAGGGIDRASSSNPLVDTTTATTTKQYNEFKNANEMMEGLARPLMDEGLASINNEYHSNKYRNGRWNRDTHRLVVIKVTPVTPIFEKKSSFFGEHIKIYELQFSLKGETRIPPSNLSELYCLHYHRWRSCKIGIVGHDFPTTITFRSQSESNSILKLFVCVDENLSGDATEGKTGWLSKQDFRALFDPHRFGVPHPNAVFTLMSVGSTTNIVRQFEALASIGHLKSHIQKALFSSRIQIQQKQAAAATTTTIAARPRSLPTDIWSSLQKNHNPYQLASISKVVSGSCKNNVCLIQGPPGTGKSSTIVGIVSALLSGKAPLPGQRQSGCLIHPGKTMGVSHSERQARNRILVCAATNIAVDTIAWKIKQGSIGPSGKVGDFKMSRFGSLPWDHVRDDGRDSVKVKKPQTLTEMEQFLYTINVDRRASDGIQIHFHDDFDDEDEDNYKCWSPEGKKVPPRRKKRKRIVGRGAKRKEIIAESSVVVTTLSGAGSKAFIDAACRDPTRNDSEFDAVIIDEACVASESETLIPLKFNPTTITLVGDPRQLPVLSLATNQSKKSLYERSLFERIQNLQWPTMLLRQQYRMHERIATFPSNQFYAGKLITSESVKNRLLSPWADHPLFPTICFWDTKRAGQSGGGGEDFTNSEESDFILRRIMTPFVRKYSGASFADDPNKNMISIGIISFYKDQVKSLQQQWDRSPVLKAAKLNVKIATVDGFQGSECDIIILSCVRSRNMKGKKTSSIGFLSDERRMNVALTRAKRSLWVVGDSDVLKANHVWKRLVDHFEREGMLRDGGNQNDFQLHGRWEGPS